MIDQQFREPDPIKDNLFAELVFELKCDDNGNTGHGGDDGQIINKIEFQRLSDYTITTKRRRPFHKGANKTTENSSSPTSIYNNNEVSINSTMKITKKNNSNDIPVAKGPMKTSLQLYLHIFSEAIEW